MSDVIGWEGLDVVFDLIGGMVVCILVLGFVIYGWFVSYGVVSG